VSVKEICDVQRRLKVVYSGAFLVVSLHQFNVLLRYFCRARIRISDTLRGIKPTAAFTFMGTRERQFPDDSQHFAALTVNINDR